MAVAIHVYIKAKGAGDDDFIPVEHIFYARNEAEADKVRLAHLAGCENFAKAEAEERTAEDVEDLADSEVPTWAEVGFDEEPAPPASGRGPRPDEPDEEDDDEEEVIADDEEGEEDEDD